MSKDHSLRLTTILLLACAVAPAGCLNDAAVVHRDAAASGGAAGGSTTGTATGGTAGSAAGGSSEHGGDGGARSSGAGGAIQSDAGKVDVVRGSGGRDGSGGAQGGGRSGTGGNPPADGTGGSTRMGGQSGSGALGTGGSVPDAAADLAAPKDTGSPELLPIPDLPVRADAPPAFWPGSAVANCTPPAIGGRAQNDGHHRAGENCMTSGCHLNPEQAEHHAGTDCRGSGCHNNGSPDGSGAPAFLFGGTVYRAATLAADPGVEVGVRTGQGFYSACSASNGNFWYLAPSSRSTATWTGATTRLRNGNGEAAMMSTPAAGCNASACHTGKLKMTSP